MRRVYNIKTGEGKWVRTDTDPGSDWTDIKPEKPPKKPTEQQALKNIAQQEKIIATLKNQGTLSSDLLPFMDKDTLEMYRGGDYTSAIQAAQDVIDYNKPYAQTGGQPKQTNVSSVMNKMPDPKLHKNSPPLKDTVTGKRYKSNGIRWMEIK